MAEAEMMLGVQPFVAESAKGGKWPDIDHRKILWLSFCVKMDCFAALAMT
jgi:hypothetical protein